MKNLTDLLELHVALDRMFFEHQRALVKLDFALALSLLDRYKICLHQHMRDEEDILLPLYAARATVSPAATVQMFLNEHVKMNDHLDLFKEHLEKLATDPEPEAALILLLDREAFYKRLCSHHDKREHDHLYPALDEITSEAEKAALMTKVTTSFDLGEIPQ
ncbi:MAG: hemerythrin domain-containing protein [Pyrinomonadaceae bacterium]